MSTEADVPKQSEDSTEVSTGEYVLKERQLGIWKAVIATTTHKPPGLWQDIRDTYPLVIRLLAEAYKISPGLLTYLFLSRCWYGIQSALDMRLENILLTQIELAISTKQVNVYPALFAICCKVLHSTVSYLVQWSKEHIKPDLKRRLILHFQVQMMRNDLKTDLPTSAEMSEREMTPSDAWSSLKKTFQIMQLIFDVSSQLWLLRKVFRMDKDIPKRGRLLFLVFLVPGIVAKYSSSLLWKLPFLAYINNDNSTRAKSLERFADGSFRQDIISNNLGDWIIAEYKKAYAALSETSTRCLFKLFRRRSPFFGLMQELSRGLPSIFFAIIALSYPKHLSIASISSIQSSGRTLAYFFTELSDEIEDIREALNTLKRVYAPEKPNLLEGGALCLTEKVDTSSKGITLTLKDVSFAYPGGGKKTNSLNEVNIDIKAGQLVVVVGANGSGKSTLTRILALLYGPSSGELRIDGLPSTEYSVADIHHVTALLSQDSYIYPLTLGENIGLGYPERCSDLDMIKEAAKEGGAAEFIDELDKGYETMLETFDDAFHMNLNGNREHPLWDMSEEMFKSTDISGGQYQRVIAARTFMRFKSGRIKLVIVDEPSSALDADGELQLFQNLIAAREGKTMVFVTHRFGYLTKFADQIICMKDGTVVESGGHEELMSADGEYAKLYNIQAQAFADGESGGDGEHDKDKKHSEGEHSTSGEDCA